MMMHHMILILQLMVGHTSSSNHNNNYNSGIGSNNNVLFDTTSMLPMSILSTLINKKQQQHQQPISSTTSVVNDHKEEEDDDDVTRKHQMNHVQHKKSVSNNRVKTDTRAKTMKSVIDTTTMTTSTTSSSSTTTVSPVVGILAQPHYVNGVDTGQQFIAASYVKWIEAGGGRSIPIPYDVQQEETSSSSNSNQILDEIFLQINGLLLPGGNNSTIPYTVRYLLDKIIDSNQNGNYFPIWGTCLGFEMLIQYIGNTNMVLQSGFNATNISLPLLLFERDETTTTTTNTGSQQHIRKYSQSTRSSKTTKPSSTNSLLYAPKHISDSVTKYSITMNNHHQGIEPKHFVQNHLLTSKFYITSINYDLNQRLFVSTIEPKLPLLYPIYGVQYHPEKNPFEYSTYPNTTIPYEAIDHSEIGISFSLYMAQFFMNLVRYGKGHNLNHIYDNPIKYPTIISYPIIAGGLSFEQIYIIPNATHWENQS